IPPADLHAQLDLLTNIMSMQNSANTVLRYLDSVKEQLKHIETTVKGLNKEPEKDLMTALTDYQKQIDDISRRLGRASEQGLGLAGGSRVTDKLGGLFGAVDGFNGAPNAAQSQYFKELEPEFRARMTETNKFISETIPQWNDKLRSWNAPTLTTRKPVEF
ncbi:MAG: hypothetical protein M3R68_05750, partial [Acidobacteriota bacterium]|nr:hypothetical protein [Acidobacteriota bacterium]